MFILPLVVPAKHVSFNLGRRLRRLEGDERWHADSPNLITELRDAVLHQALPFVSGIESPRDVARAASALRRPYGPRVQEAIAYSLARSGEIDVAESELTSLVESLDVSIPWQSEAAKRALALQSDLRSNPRVAEERLIRWEAETLHNLGMESFADESPRLPHKP